MVTKLMLDCSEELWKEVRLHKVREGFKTSNDAVIDLIKKGLKIGCDV